MKQIGFHYKEKKRWQNFAIFSLMIFLIAFACYKNGFFYFIQGKMSIMDALQPLFYFLCSFGLYLFSRLILRKKITKNGLITSILLGLMIPPRFPLWCFIVSLVIFALWYQLFNQKLSTISSLLIFKIVTIIFSFLLSIDYQNVVELSFPYVYNLVDIFLGHSVGNLGTTSIILLLLLYGLLSTDYYYKKELSLIYLITFGILEVGYILFFSHTNLLVSLFNSHVWFAGVILVPEKGKSPAEKKSLMFYGICLGILTFILTSVLNITDGVYLALFAMQILWSFVFYFQKKKLLK